MSVHEISQKSLTLALAHVKYQPIPLSCCQPILVEKFQTKGILLPNEPENAKFQYHHYNNIYMITMKSIIRFNYCVKYYTTV